MYFTKILDKLGRAGLETSKLQGCWSLR